MRGFSARTCVIALGSPHGDDQVAWVAAARLREQLPAAHPPVVLGEPVRLLDHLAGCQRLLILDACRSGRPPGSIVRLEWPDPRIERTPSASTHMLPLADVLRLAETLRQLPPRVVLFALEITDTRPGTELTPDVAAAVPDLVRRVLREVRGEGKDALHA